MQMWTLTVTTELAGSTGSELISHCHNVNSSPCTHNLSWRRVKPELQPVMFHFRLLQYKWTSPRATDHYFSLLPQSFNFVKLKVLQMSFSFWLHGCKMEIHYQSNSLKTWTDFLLRRSLMLWTINPSNHHKKYASSPMLCFTWQENEATLTQLLVDAAGWNAATFLTLLPLSYQGGCLLTAAAVWPGHHSEFLMLTQHLNGQLNVKLWLKRPPISNSQTLVGCKLHQCKFDNSYNDKIIPFLLNTDKLKLSRCTHTFSDVNFTY